MDRKFDLREQRDRAELAEFLPTFDGRTIEVPAPVFVEALSFLSDCLGQPDWLTYQWGMVGPFHDGKTQHPFDLPRIVHLALELKELWTRDNFAALLAGFSNPPQFLDTVFETHTASFFSRLRTTNGMTFSPARTARGHDKRPDFEVNNEVGPILVECKRPHPVVQRAAETFVVSRDSPFRIPDPKFGYDVMVLDSDEATGLFNPQMTMMRVVHNGLDHKFARSAGARLAEALRQLPSEQEGVIALGEVPRRIAEAAIARRIGERAYDHILAFVVNEIDSSDFHFTYRTGRGPRVQQMVSAGLKPLFVV